MLSENDIKEELNYAYIHAVAAYAGFSCDRPSKDRDSVDVTIRAKDRLDEESIIYSPTLDLQLKASSGFDLNAEIIPFDLPIKNYNELRQYSQSPRLLVVMALPADKEEWLQITPEQLIARRCCYWHSLSDEPQVSNTRTRRIQIRTSQVFTPQSLRELLVKASRQEKIKNDL